MFPPDPDPVESTPPEPDYIEGLSLQMTQAINHYQKQECKCFVCRDTGHFARDACPKDQSLGLTTRVASYPGVAPTLETGPTARWVGPETLVDVMLEGCEVLALADSGSQVNMIMPEFIQERGYLVLPLDGLVNYPLHLVGLGGQHTCPLGFVITRLQVREVARVEQGHCIPGGS